MRRPSHYTKANLLWSTTAYCDQWNKVMAIYDKNDNLRMVVAEDPEEETYDVLLIGEDEKLLLSSYGFELGSTSKNMNACFTLYRYFEGDECVPKFMPTPENKMIIKVYDILVHTKASAIKHGGFKICDDASKEIAMAVAALREAKATMDQYCLDEEEYDDPVVNYDEDSLDGWIHSITGGDPMEELFVRSGVFDD